MEPHANSPLLSPLLVMLLMVKYYKQMHRITAVTYTGPVYKVWKRQRSNTCKFSEDVLWPVSDEKKRSPSTEDKENEHSYIFIMVCHIHFLKKNVLT